MNDSVVHAVDLHRRFGSVPALDGVNLEVSRGSILALLGPNGAGKTTLLRILVGLIEPTAGRAEVLGRPARRLSAADGGRIAYVGDRCAPPSWATLALLEDLQAGAVKDFDRDFFRELCCWRGLTPRRPYGALSKGQRRWVLTSLALAARPELLLLDEPADGLDPAARRDLYDCLRKHVTGHEATAIVTTHVLADVERVADDVAILETGRLVFEAPLEDLREEVRQVEIPNDSLSPTTAWCPERARVRAEDTENGFSLLGAVQREDVQILWIRRNGISDEKLCEKFGPHTTIRTVDLETLYLTIIEHSPDIVDTHGVQHN
ncbi:MAG: ABC transporter ATP-binding protein [Pirellulales bacterium]|nr:ABC transporter ATP-binding protein [Pirellulales bacterium]